MTGVRAIINYSPHQHQQPPGISCSLPATSPTSETWSVLRRSLEIPVSDRTQRSITFKAGPPQKWYQKNKEGMRGGSVWSDILRQYYICLVWHPASVLHLFGPTSSISITSVWSDIQRQYYICLVWHPASVLHLFGPTSSVSITSVWSDIQRQY